MKPVQFGCTLCGECCSGDMKVFVNSYDLYKMGRFLKVNHTDDLFDRGIIVLDKGQNNLDLPRIQFKTEPFSFCPFLINDFDEDRGLTGRCSMHLEHKPLVCRLAPLSRVLDLESGTDEFEFILPHPACPGKTVNQILDPAEEKKLLAEELALEKRYYSLLSRHEDAPRFLWSFSLENPFESVLETWEE